ncbi:MAG: prephenate dehydrogenase/arogenate dehydrogenase family protein [Clostridia bacterium]|jgi:prephenate dehydrogenase|nr:prephenate dehydrogenase/arogenate dehydrogenase family protein [Clostridia bacterium]MCI2000948.1 prephenate dehydrogenase/arogenate dehydrogenase family protein [Clostridia bacterium]MCI2015732.1 prephenate dehydrogenase/arogenate dehydrogenase family protein [Clostridia bacterium]
MLKKVGIIGLGLIGGSLAKALRKRVGVEKIVALNRNEDVLKTAYNEGVIDEYTLEINSVFSDCDIVFICTPVNFVFDYAKKLIPFVDKNCIISDVGSTKGKIYEHIKEISDNFFYIGGHPMTGSEKFRYTASKEHLFENAYYILAPAENVPEKKIDYFKKIILKIGAIPVIVSPFLHDYITASISHVPHIIAAGLCNNVKMLDTKEHHMHQIAAGGFKDITRIASSNPEMWESICFENKDEILKVIASLEKVIGRIKKDLSCEDHEDVHKYFDEARLYRDSFSNVTPGSFVKRYEISIDVLDKPGSIAIIAVLFSSNNLNIKNMNIVNNRERENGVLKVSFESESERQKAIRILREMNYDVYSKD